MPRINTMPSLTVPLQLRAESSTTSTTGRPNPSTVSPTPSSNSNSNSETTGGGNNLARSVLEFALLAVALFFIGCIILRRITHLKRRNRPMSHFFSFLSNSPPPPSPPVFFHSYPRTHGLRPFDPSAPPLAYDPRRRTRAQDTDEGGRRLGYSGYLDHDGPLSDKDALPAYDRMGGPPVYSGADAFGVEGRIPAPLTARWAEGERTPVSALPVSVPGPPLEPPPPIDSPSHCVEHVEPPAAARPRKET